MAEREGFEPSKHFHAYTVSNRAPSATRTSLRGAKVHAHSLARRSHDGGERGIRTLDTLTGIAVFETARFSHSRISPRERIRESGLSFQAVVRRAAPCSEELLEHLGALVGPHSGHDLGPVIEPQILGHHGERAARARLGIARAVDHSGHAREHDRAGAHVARLEGDVERGLVQPPGLDRLAGGADGQDLGVGRRILGALDPVVPAADDAAVPDDHGADGHFSFGRGGARLRERGFEVAIVLGPRAGHHAGFSAAPGVTGRRETEASLLREFLERVADHIPRHRFVPRRLAVRRALDDPRLVVVDVRARDVLLGGESLLPRILRPEELLRTDVVEREGEADRGARLAHAHHHDAMVLPFVDPRAEDRVHREQ